MKAWPAAAAIAMMAWPTIPADATVLHVELCNGGTAQIPIDREHKPKRDCASPCHALVGRKRSQSV